MGITSISRAWVTNPQFVTITSTDNLAAVTATGYIKAQEDNIIAVNNGRFDWQDGDFVFMFFDDGTLWDFFTYVPATQSLVQWTAATGLSATLSDAELFVGNGANVATGVALSGDATIANTGVLTIEDDAVTTVKINDAAVTLAKLATGITPSHVIKYAGKEADGGGNATIAIAVAGVAATDVVFAQVEASTNAVTVQKVTPTANTITVLLSGDPGAATSIAYQALRAAV